MKHDDGFDLQNDTEWPLEVSFPDGVAKEDARLGSEEEILSRLFAPKVVDLLVRSIKWVDPHAIEHVDFQAGVTGAFEYTVMVQTKPPQEAIANSKPIVIIDP